MYFSPRKCTAAHTTQRTVAMTTVIHFVSGNAHKRAEMRRLNGHLLPRGVELAYVDLDLPEIQGDADAVAMEKCRSAAKLVDGPVFVEDTSLEFLALGTMPGVYIKWFYQTGVKNEGLIKMLQGFEDKDAIAKTTIAYAGDRDSTPIVFHGVVRGKIVTARGPPSFCWDQIFQPDGSALTFAEMSPEEKDAGSQRRLAFQAFSEYLHARAAS
jgi:inosine triphosphate pyrophosphatase